MELHKIQEALHINDNIRVEFSQFCNEAFAIGMDRKSIMDLFRIIFIQKYYMEPSNFKSFVQVITMDTYMMLLLDMKQNSLGIDDWRLYMYISSFISEPAKLYEEIFNDIDQNTGFFQMMLDYSIYFEKLGILGKKTVVQSSRDCEEQITKLCPVYQLDVINYGLATTVEDFINYYNEAIESFVLPPDMIVKDIEYHMRHLYSFNRENYIDNLKQMAEGFYKWIKIQIDMNDFVDENLKNYIELLENKTLEEICELSITNKNFLFHIIDFYCEYMISDEIVVRETHISRESLDEYMKDKIPVSLQNKKNQKAKK